MKKALLVLSILLCAFSAGAQQAPKAKAFAEVCDSLKVRLKRRTGVTTRVKLDRVLQRGNTLDFYFAQNMVGQPYRKGDITWLTQQIEELGKDILGNYKVGTLYAQNQKLSELPQPAPGKDGSALGTVFRVKERTDIPLVQGDDQWPLGLSGRHIALWQSHGRYYTEDPGMWDWQRSPNHRTLEDVYTQSYIIPFLIPMLENAGAVVLTPRERDIQTNEVVCDNDPSFTEGRDPGVRTKGKYQESGAWEDAGVGFADFQAVYKGYDAPFQMGTARKIHTAAQGEDPARIVWRPNIQEKGSYAVYVSYKTIPGFSTSDARYTVHHLGGSTLRHVNQQMGGGMWVYLGTFLFDKGTEGYVELTNTSSVTGVVTADAVRFGGGMGKVERGGSLSGMPAYIEGALYNFQYSGIPMTIADEWEGDYKKDYASRGAWVQHLSGGSRVNPEATEGRHIPFDMSLAFHTDAGVTPNDSIIGTLAIYTLKCQGSDKLPNGESRLSSRLLCDLVQSQVVDDIRATYEPKWTRREIWDKSYSESRTTGVPALLLELLSHQNFADMRYGLDPGFRFTACRAVYKGILKFLSARYGVPYAVQPLPVRAFKATLDSTEVTLSWAETRDMLEPTAVADYYKVYTRVDNGGFNAGRQIKETECQIPLEPGHVYSFKITACNAGGESFPSEILAAGYPSANSRKVTVVNNFTRVSAPAWFDSERYGGFLDNLDSGVPWGTDILFAGVVNNFDRQSEYTSNDNPGHGGSFWDMAGSQIAGNSFDFVASHGKAVLDAGFAFDSSSALAFDGSSNAFAADIICGKQLTTRTGTGAVPDRFQVFPDALQSAIRAFTGKGGNIVISGSYIGTDAWDHVYPDVPKAPESTRTFVKNVLGYRWVTNFGDISGRALPQAGSGLPGISYNRNWTSSIYKVDNADGIAPAGINTKILLRYQGTDIPAGTLYNGKGYQVAAFGFPLETSAQMGQVLKTVLHSFGQLNTK